MKYLVKVVCGLMFMLLLAIMNIGVNNEGRFTVSLINQAIANDEEESPGTGDEEEPERIEVNGGSGGGGDSWGGDWGSDGGQSGVDGGGGGGSAPAPTPPPEPEPEETKEVCLAEANLQYRSCMNSVIGPGSQYQNTVSYECPTFFDVDVGIKVIFGGITVRNYDSCMNVANAQRDGYVNGCEMSRAMHELQCAKK